jgi:hypothetical protein
MDGQDDPSQGYEQHSTPLAPAPMRRRTPALRAGISVVGIVSVLVGASVVFGAAAPAPFDPQRPVVDASASPSASADDDDKGFGPRLDKLQKLRGLGQLRKFAAGNGLGLGLGLGRLGGRAFGKISITAISGDSISLKTDDGWTRTISVTTDTKVFRGTKAATAADLKVGDTILLRQKRNDDGTFAITAIVVPVPFAAGEVTAVDADTITIKARDGSSKTIHVTASTTYHLGRGDGTKADVKVGSTIAVQGDVDASDLTAAVVWVAVPHIAGEVTAKTSSSITIKRRDGTSATIHISSSTTFRIRGKGAAATLADVTVGMRVEAEGALRADGSMDASAVGAGRLKPDKVANGGDDQDDEASPAPSG